MHKVWLVDTKLSEVFLVSRYKHANVWLSVVPVQSVKKSVTPDRPREMVNSVRQFQREIAWCSRLTGTCKH